MSWHVAWSKQAVKQMRALDRRQRAFIDAWVRENLEGCTNPRAIIGSKQLQGTRNGWRYRVGSYRVLARLVDDTLIIQVVRVGHRQGVYGNLPDM